jgi:two-component system, NarL family, sensor histidine kinase UhpB
MSRTSQRDLPNSSEGPLGHRPGRARTSFGREAKAGAPLPSSPSFFWRVFVVNAGLLGAAAVLLALTPATISFPVTVEQVLVLAIGLMLVLIANAFLLRFSLRPLYALTQAMERIDLLVPGERVEVRGARELTAVATTFNEMLERLENERKASFTRSVAGQEEERRRLASDLHDEIGQRLTAVLLQLTSLSDEVPPQLQPQVTEVRDLIRDNLEEVRRIARGLRPTILDDLGLPYALLGLIDSLEQATNLEIERRIDFVQQGKVSDVVELALYRIAQEALTNVIRHANATRVEVVLALVGGRGRLILRVSDNGRGMLYAPDVEGGGVRGMRERAVLIGGQFSFRSQPAIGTRVEVTVPVGAA